MRLLRPLALLFVLVLDSIAIAQTTNTGTVLGLITDPSGAVMPNVSVQLTDTATGISRSVTSNQAGHYVFPGVAPGTYSVKATAQGFQQTIISEVVVEVGKSSTVNLELKIGEARQVIEVATAPGAELQMLDASVGTVIGGESLRLLPTLSRSATSLILFQPTSMPQQAATQGSSYGGQVAGARSDQNMIVLDGGNITAGVSANNDYVNARGLFNGGPEGAIPTPVESIQEFRVATSNAPASFSGSSGAESVMVTKRGSNTFHGGGYWFLQNDNLNANGWERNRLLQRRPESKDNRFGASLGGYIPKLPEAARTWFYLNYEGDRRLDSAQVSRIVPSETLKQGVLRFRDSAGNVVSYDLARSTACGAAGNAPCDPRRVGLSPVVNALWSRYMPAGNDISTGDELNTIGFSAPAILPDSSEFVVVRLDHSFGSNWQLFASYRYYTQTAATVRQTDIGGLLPGHTKGQVAPTFTIPRQPRYVVLGLTGTITPTLTNEVNAGYVRDWWKWGTASLFPQVPGTAAALSMGGNVQFQLQPISSRTTDARQRAWLGHVWNLRDNVSWQKSTHFIRAGGTFSRANVNFWRDDGQVGSVIPQYYVTQTSGLNIPATYRPPACTGSVTTNCLPANQVSNWNNYYAQALGLVDQALVVGVRGSDLGALPLGTVLFTHPTYYSYSLYATDSWKVTPTLTVNYGLNWSVDLPPVDSVGKQAMSLILPGNTPLIPSDYLAARREAALKGAVYNPTIGFAPVAFTNRKYPYDAVYDTIAPRVAIAWNPKFSGGVMERLFGNGKTAIRAGYGQLFDRLNGVQKVGNFLQGFGFQQTLTCLGPSRAGQCLGAAGVDPATGFRIGVDGSSVPLPAMTASAAAPLVPGTANVAGANQPPANTTYQIDPAYRPGRNHQWDFTIQREMPGRSLLELGYIGRHANNLYNNLEVNHIPYMMTLGGQSYAQAFDAVAAQLRAGAAVTPQPFFENALAGSSLCATPNASCTAGVVSRFSGSFTSQQVANVFNGIQSSFRSGPATTRADQIQSSMFFWASTGWSSYNAAFVSYRTRNFKGLTLDTNLTWSHALDTRGLNQDVDTASSNSYDPRYDYGTSLFDRKLVFNLLSNYELPFMSKRRGLLAYVVQGWSVAPILTIASGLPLRVATGSGQEFGQVGSTNGAGAIPITEVDVGNSVHSGIAGNAIAAINGDPARGGTGLNLFADPAAVFRSFRPAMVSIDTTSGGGGQLRGLPRWNVDLAISRKFRISERWSTSFTGQFFNLFNTVQFADPSVSLQSPQSFGVLSRQLNEPRAVQLGLRVDF